MVRLFVVLTAVAVTGLLIPAVAAVHGQVTGTPEFVVASPAADPCAAATGTPAGTTSTGATPAPADVSFDLVYLDLSLMHADHTGAVARVVAGRAEHEELRELGAGLAARLDQWVRRLGVWRSLWFGNLPPLTDDAIVGAIDRLPGASPGRGGLPGAFEILGMAGAAGQACAAVGDDRALLDLLIRAVDADVLLAEVAVAEAEHEELKVEARVIAGQDRRWLDALIALRARWYGEGATPAASPAATPA